MHTQLIRSGDDVTGVRRNRLRIEVIGGPDQGQLFELTDDRIVVGTDESCEVTLTDPTVSRQHIEIVPVATGYRIRDLDSLNGVRLDGIRLEGAVVKQPVTLHLGQSQVRVSPTSETVDVPISSEIRCGPLLGRSPAMRKVFDVLRRVAPTPSTVLITGESGTGKEVTARAIHELSSRAAQRFVVVDCGALPPTLIESELYGHERGAFTGADRARKGAFEEASGGTLFLDEIGELPLDLQTRLLGAIERRQIQPLGGARPRAVDVRVVAATNRDLRREVNRGNFRSDLYFRLAVVHVELPPLRERAEDIPLYVEAFIEEWASMGHPLTIEPQTIEALKKRSWPGNVRELRNALERAAALGMVDDISSGPVVSSEEPSSTGDTVEARIDPEVPFKTAKGLLIQSFEHQYVQALMAKHNNNITQAARAAEIDRVYLLRLLDKFNMRPTKRG